MMQHSNQNIQIMVRLKMNRSFNQRESKTRGDRLTLFSSIRHSVIHTCCPVMLLQLNK